jgi:hypothetical protein
VDYETDCHLGDRVGWRKNSKWGQDYDQLICGHLPSVAVLCEILGIILMGKAVRIGDHRELLDGVQRGELHKIGVVLCVLSLMLHRDW